MGFEDRFLSGLDQKRERRSELAPVMERGYLKAATMLREPDYCIQERNFVEVYGEEVVQADMARVTRLRSKFDRDQTETQRTTKKIATILEGVVLQESEMSNWFGENATTIKTSDYDDFINKVDLITEWQTPGENSRILALATDVTFGFNSALEKLRELRSEIDAGKLGSLKYFEDVHGDFKGSRFNVPRTVIGVSQPVVEEIAQLWVSGEKRLLGEHPIQRVIVEQMHSQLEAMRGYAASKGAAQIVTAYDRALSAVRPLQESKRHIPFGKLSDDPVVNEIAQQTRHQFRTN